MPRAAHVRPWRLTKGLGYRRDRLGIRDAIFADGHGSNAKQAVLEQILASN
jgi:hypothetical protein